MNQSVTADVDFVVSHLKEIVRRCMQDKPATDKKGEPVVDEENNKVYAFDPAHAYKALELLGKHPGMFSEKPAAMPVWKEGDTVRIIIDGVEY